MNKKNDDQFCTISPDFPQNGYLVFLFISDNEKIVNIIPMLPLYSSLSALSDSIKKMTNHIEETKDIIIDENLLLIPAKLLSLYPLKKTFWKKPSQNYDLTIRYRSFLPVASHPEFYQLLVTPSHIDNHLSWNFDTALPLYISSNFTLIEKFMLYSNWPVAIEAKHAAIYRLENSSIYNWHTGEFALDEKIIKIDLSQND